MQHATYNVAKQRQHYRASCSSQFTNSYTHSHSNNKMLCKCKFSLFFVAFAWLGKSSYRQFVGKMQRIENNSLSLSLDLGKGNVGWRRHESSASTLLWCQLEMCVVSLIVAFLPPLVLLLLISLIFTSTICGQHGV